MRVAFTAAVNCLGLLLMTMHPAIAQPTTPGQTEAPHPGPGQRPPESGVAQSDAAEKHAKRTACLKDAKTRKLIGDQKAAYLKDCMAAADAPKPINSN